MKRYEKMKDSGVEWVGEIPNEWGAKKLGYVANIQGRVGYKGYKSEDLVDAEYGCLVLGGKHLDSNQKINLKDPTYLRWDKYYESPEIMVKTGDLIVSQRGTLGKVVFVDDDYGEMTINPSLVLLNRIKEEPKFLWYFLQSSYILSIVELHNSNTAVPMLSQEQISNFKILSPPKNEQTQIVSFLDDKTAKIDSLIEKKQRKIELLREKRKALINHAVTKGLNPDAPMKDSGVEWIGEIPEGWTVKALKYVSDLVNEKVEATEKDIRISPEYVEPFTGRVENLYSQYSGIGMSFKKGDTLFNKLRVYLAKVVLAEFDGLSMGEMIVLRPQKIHSAFQFYTLLSSNFIDWCNIHSYGVKQPRTSIDTILNSKMPVPPLSEQKEIATYISSQTSEIDCLIKKENQKIELLKEYRQSLISEAVTGKIDVRDYGKVSANAADESSEEEKEAVA